MFSVHLSQTLHLYVVLYIYMMFFVFFFCPGHKLGRAVFFLRGALTVDSCWAIDLVLVDAYLCT